jgi:2-C-methyl-D-erythritol 4-phosphate cytidylyltransferase
VYRETKVGVIVPAAGSGRRMAAAGPKALIPIGDTPILVRTLRTLQGCPEVDDIVVVARPGEGRDIGDALKGEGLDKVRKVIPGGDERQDSVRAGLAALAGGETGIVLVHDAARPFVEPETVAGVVAAAYEHGAAVAAVRSKDTVKIVRGEDFTAETPDRRTCWLAQTPQGFRMEIFSRAMESATVDRFYGTDDARLVERLGGNVIIVEGTYRNIKITTPEDLEMASFFVKTADGGHGAS